MTLYLYYPSSTLGGAELLLLRVGQWLAQRGWLVKVLDRPEGFLGRQAQTYGLGWVPIEKEGKIAIEQGVILMPASELFSLHRLSILGPEVKVFLWVIHPFNLFPAYPLLGRFLLRRPRIRRWFYELFLKSELRRLRRFYDLAQHTGAIAFMDRACVDYNRDYLSRAHEAEFLPIPLASSDGSMGRELIHLTGDEASIRFGWVGRIDKRMKLPVLKILLRDLNHYGAANQQRLNISLIGDGDGLTDLRHFSRALEHVRCEFVGVMPHDSLQGYLDKNIDLLFAMGTSALEGGLASLPTVLVDVCVSADLRYRYRWLYETSGYSLGYIVATDEDIPLEADKSVFMLIEDFNRNSVEIAQRCRKYVVGTHALDSIGRTLDDRLSRSSLNMSQLRSMKLLGPRRFR